MENRSNSDPEAIIINCLHSAGGPMTVSDIYAITRLPLPLITRTLQQRARATHPDVMRRVRGSQVAEVTYEWVGVNPGRK